MSVDTEVIRTLIGLALLVFAYHILGSYQAYLDKTKVFSWSITLKGLSQGLFVLLAIAAIYVAGQLVPNVQVMQIGESVLTISTAIALVLTLAFASYGYKTIKMLLKVFNIDVGQTSATTGNETLDASLELAEGETSVSNHEEEGLG